MDASSSSNTGTAPQKRVLPARSRRGGPGVGNCDVDVMILEAHKRKMEMEPLVPADTPFLLTTNSSKFSLDSERDSETTFTVNTVANERYFDRPEVLRAFREQQIIQTPDFEAINESSTVGGRFRPRGAEDETAETSDAAYEKRHKKFETFEKRQRLREKEKLKHEHYKLKERIEQLRAMDSSAFMAVPASSFSEPPPEDPLETEEVVLHPNGMVVNLEGERRRKEMLDNALALERRYSYLLPPPDRGRKLTHDAVFHAESHHEDESDTDRISQVAGSSRRDASESFKFRLTVKSSASNTPTPSPAAVSAFKPSVGRKPKATAPITTPLNVITRSPAVYRAIQTPASFAAQHEHVERVEHVEPVAVAVPTVTATADESRPSPSPTPPPESPSASPAVAPVPIVVTSAVRGKKRGRGGRPPNGNLFGRQNKTKPADTLFEPVAEPITEPVAEPIAEPVAEPIAEPIEEPAVEPAVEPVAEPVALSFELNDDGESEKALSDDEEMHPKHLSPERETQPESAPSPAPASTPAPAPAELPEDGDAEMQELESEIQPERRETVENTQPIVAPEPEAPQEVVQDHEIAEPPVSEVAVEEGADAATAEEDSISIRPAKRPKSTRGTGRGTGRGRGRGRGMSRGTGRGMGRGMSRGRGMGRGTGRGPGRPPRAVSTATASEDLVSPIALSANASTVAGHKRVPRGAAHYKSESGTEESTFSLLIMAAIKRESTKRGGEKRHNTSFGIQTPSFKEEYDFELPESFFYPEADVSRLPKVNDEEFVSVAEPDSESPYTREECSEDGAEADDAAEDDEHADGSEDLEETKEADEREVSEGADSEMTEPMDIDQPDPIKEVPTTRASTTPEEETEEDELTDEIDIMHEPDNEPGVTPRELSFPMGDQEEILEW